MTRVDVQPAPDVEGDGGAVKEHKQKKKPSAQTDDDTAGDRASKQSPPHNNVKHNKISAIKDDTTDDNAQQESQTPPQKESKHKMKMSTKRSDTHSVKDSAEVDEESLSSTWASMGLGRSCTPKHSFLCRIIFFLLLVSLDVADLFSDWLFYADVSNVEKGLVYGPPETAVIHALLAFSIIGSITFLFETVNLWKEAFRDDPWLDVELVSAVIIWIEDLPQIALNLHIARCREDPVSVFQLSKAAVVLLSLAIRFIISCVKYCNKRALQEANQPTAESKRHKFYRAFIFLGLLINAACASAVFVFTQTQRNVDGNIQFLVPKTIFEDQYNDQRYFQNVSVFIHHPDFDVTAPSGATNYKANWMRFMSINDIRDRADIDISYNYVYEKTASHMRMAMFVKEDKTGNGRSGTWRVSECYEMDLGSHQITNVTCQASFFSSGAKSLFITFTFVSPSPIFRKLIFGDIRFNAKVYESQVCREYGSFAESVSDSPALPSIHYYRTTTYLPPRNMRHLLVDGGIPRFYRNNGVDLQDVTEVWKTGWDRCESSGSRAPHFQQSIPIECSNPALAAVTG